MSRNWRPTDLTSDEGAVDSTVDRLLQPLLAEPNLAAEWMPPGRREWFEDFIRGSLEQALLACDPQSITDRGNLLHLWESFSRDLAAHGVVRAIADILQLIHDPDGKEVDRGWAYHAHEEARLFLQDHHVGDVMESAVAAKDAALWGRYPGWFGNNANVAFYRARAVRFLPYYNPTLGWLLPLLDDEISQVRYFAAMHIALVWPDRADDAVLARLVEASEDDTWTWSWADHFNSCRIGREEALDVLGRIADRPSVASAPERRATKTASRPQDDET